MSDCSYKRPLDTIINPSLSHTFTMAPIGKLYAPGPDAAKAWRVSNLA